MNSSNATTDQAKDEAKKFNIVLIFCLILIDFKHPMIVKLPGSQKYSNIRHQLKEYYIFSSVCFDISS